MRGRPVGTQAGVGRAVRASRERTERDAIGDESAVCCQAKQDAAVNGVQTTTGERPRTATLFTDDQRVLRSAMASRRGGALVALLLLVAALWVGRVAADEHSYHVCGSFDCLRVLKGH